MEVMRIFVVVLITLTHMNFSDHLFSGIRLSQMCTTCMSDVTWKTKTISVYRCRYH